MVLLSRREPWPGIFATLADMVDDPMVRESKEYLADVLTKYGPIAEAPLRRLLSEGWWAVRTHAADGLAKVGTPDAIPDLSALASPGHDPYVRERARKAIEAILARHPEGPAEPGEGSGA